MELQNCWKRRGDSISPKQNNAAGENKAGRGKQSGKVFQAQTCFPENMKKPSAAGRGSAEGVAGQDGLFTGTRRDASVRSPLPQQKAGRANPAWDLVGPQGRLSQGDCLVLRECARTRPGSVLVSPGVCC